MRGGYKKSEKNAPAERPDENRSYSYTKQSKKLKTEQAGEL